MNNTIDRHFIALSDSASLFVPSWQPTLMLDYILSVADSAKPRLRYIGAAKGDQPQRIAEFYRLAERSHFIPEVLSFFELERADPAGFFKGADIVYFDGGSTRNLLAILREWDAIDALRNAYAGGTVLVGASAGASMLFERCVTDSARSEIAPYPGIGLLPGTICVHHGSRAERREVFSAMLLSEDSHLPGYALDDGAALHFISGRLAKGVAIHDRARCVQVAGRTRSRQLLELERLDVPARMVASSA